MSERKLNPAQQKAVDSPMGPLLIVAGAGTGKTETLTSRLVKFIETGVQPEKIVALTFTNKAAREMESRAKNAIVKNGGKIENGLPWIGTFHAFGASILRKESVYIHRSPGFLIFDSHDSNQVVKKIVAQSPGRMRLGPAYFRSEIEKSKNYLSQPSSDALEVYQMYENFLQESDALDFEDLLEKVVRIWQEHAEILKKYQNKYSHILVDEYQDTNPVQRELVRLLAGDKKNLSVVGDDQQTIYTWRGSDVRAFLDFESDWPGAKVLVLDQNYRSTPDILATAQAVIEENQFQRKKNLWTENRSGDKTRLLEFANADKEAQGLAQEIKRLINSGGSLVFLYRTNAQTRPLESALIRAGVPYRIYGGLRFYERKEIKDVLAGIRLAIGKNDLISLERLEKISKRSTARFLEQKKQVGEIRTTSQALELFLTGFGYLEHLDKNFGDARERRENILELSSLAQKDSEPAKFLEEITLLDGRERKLEEENKNKKNVLYLSTIHLAKGLEFDRVYIVGCQEGLMPHTWAAKTEEEIEEERRLLYVAMTRARKNLTMSFSGTPSRFLSSVPSDLLDYESNIEEEDWIELD